MRGDRFIYQQFAEVTKNNFSKHALIQIRFNNKQSVCVVNLREEEKQSKSKRSYSDLDSIIKSLVWRDE